MTKLPGKLDGLPHLAESLEPDKPAFVSAEPIVRHFWQMNVRVRPVVDAKGRRVRLVPLKRVWVGLAFGLLFGVAGSVGFAMALLRGFVPPVAITWLGVGLSGFGMLLGFEIVMLMFVLQRWWIFDRDAGTYCMWRLFCRGAEGRLEDIVAVQVIHGRTLALIAPTVEVNIALADGTRLNVTTQEAEKHTARAVKIAQLLAHMMGLPLQNYVW